MKTPRQVRFVVYRDRVTKRWHYALRAAGNEHSWFVSSPRGYSRKERAAANCRHIWALLRGLDACPVITIEEPADTSTLGAELLSAIGKKRPRPPLGPKNGP